MPDNVLLRIAEHERDCPLHKQVASLTVDVARLATTIKVWGSVVSVLLVLVGGLGVWAIRGIAAGQRAEAEHRTAEAIVMRQ